MAPIKIKGFDPNRLEELAKTQTEIYNTATAKLPNFTPAKVDKILLSYKNNSCYVFLKTPSLVNYQRINTYKGLY